MAPLSLSSNYKYWMLVVVLLLGVVEPPPARSDFASDREECSSQLPAVQTCLQYVQGKAAAPTPNCCSGLKQVVAANSIKCLCMIVRDRNEPQLGLTINASLALGLPSKCSVQSNVSDCPRLLNLAPNSTDAQIFEQYAKDHPDADSAAGALGNNNSTATSSSRENERSSRLTMAMSLAFLILLHVRVQVRRKEHAQINVSGLICG
ncbi:non-specific lipid transfer protein GPI-anchored 13-like [Zingiber officinale]|uniref:non-specific lipid transfer protein GPI-anchored 13-like n=1 Tax=Zingiber officinale TaxID=94328 RepID=UPI001C4C2E71|nr:non-specific lipid transfer protein GPI-anchored 13-like [Zingiber officinale]